MTGEGARQNPCQNLWVEKEVLCRGFQCELEDAATEPGRRPVCGAAPPDGVAPPRTRTTDLCGHFGVRSHQGGTDLSSAEVTAEDHVEATGWVRDESNIDFHVAHALLRDGAFGPAMAPALTIRVEVASVSTAAGVSLWGLGEKCRHRSCHWVNPWLRLICGCWLVALRSTNIGLFFEEHINVPANDPSGSRWRKLPQCFFALQAFERTDGRTAGPPGLVPAPRTQRHVTDQAAASSSGRAGLTITQQCVNWTPASPPPTSRSRRFWPDIAFGCTILCGFNSGVWRS